MTSTHHSSVKTLFSFLVVFLFSGVGIADPKDPFADYLRKPMDPFIHDFVSNRQSQIVRSPLDARVYKLITQDPKYSELTNEIRHAFQAVVEHQRQIFEATLVVAGSGGSKAGKKGGGIHGDTLQLVKDTARQMGFRPEAIRNLRVFIADTPEKNAFTYSANPLTHLDMVIFTGLIKSMTRGELQAVVAHELAHVKFEHILEALVVEAVFNASFEILVPTDEEMERLREQEAKKTSRRAAYIGNRETLLTMLRTSLRESTRASLRFQDLLPKGGLSGTAAMIETLLNTAEGIGQRFGQRKPNDVRDMAGAMIQMLSSQEFLPELIGERASRVFNILAAKEPEDMKEAMKMLQEALGRLSNANKQSSDQMAIVVAGPKNVSGAMAALMGSTTEAALDQVVSYFNRHHLSAQRIQLHHFGDSHPGILSRVNYPFKYQEYLEYQLQADPFLRVLDLYFAMSREIHAADTVISERTLHPMEALNLDARRKLFIDPAKRISQLVISSIIAEFEEMIEPKGRVGRSKGDESLVHVKKLVDSIEPRSKLENSQGDESLARFMKLLGYLDLGANAAFRTPFALDLQTGREELMQEMGKTGRMLYELTKAIAHLKVKHEGKLSEAMTKVLDQSLESLSRHFEPVADSSSRAKIQKAVDALIAERARQELTVAFEKSLAVKVQKEKLALAGAGASLAKCWQLQ